MVDSANLFSMQRTARGTLLFAEAEPAAWCGVARSIRSRISRNHAADFGVLVSTCPTRIWQASTNDRNASRSIEPLPARAARGALRISMSLGRALKKIAHDRVRVNPS